jgi:signal transduction histidine kinase
MAGPPKIDGSDPAWRRLRGRFMWRIGIVVVAVFFLAVAAGTLTFLLVASAFGYTTDTMPVLLPSRGPVAIVLLILAIVLGGLVRTMRRAAMPVADLLEAAGKVEIGDYSVRVIERGPREIRALINSFNAMVTRLELNDQQRRNLLADVTHELRTPLTIIQGNLEGLLDGVYPRDDAHLAMILDETRIFARLVEDLRTLAQVESGTMTLRLEQTDIRSLVNDSVASLMAQANDVGVELVTFVDPNLPALRLDAVRIHAVIDNLILNALRYTPHEGRIVISATLASTRDHVTVAVTDNGKGIPMDVLPHIFERFYKSTDSRGSGLGLAIARHIVLAHHGEINAESEAGKGTTVRFMLPVNPA